jgi:hypothetical protein
MPVLHLSRVMPKKRGGLISAGLFLFNLPIDQRYFLILQVMPSIRFLYSDEDREPAVRYCGRSGKLVFRFRITFGAAVIVVNFLHHGMVRPPVEAAGVTMPVDRPMTPAPKFRPMPVRRTIVMPSVEFWFEPGSRAIKMLPEMIAGTAVTDSLPVKIAVSGPIPWLKLVASIWAAIAASFAQGPGITGQGHHKSNQYNADDDDLFFHGLSPCFRDLMHGYPGCLTQMTDLISEKFTKKQTGFTNTAKTQGPDP